MRTPIALALVLAACGQSDHVVPASAHGAPTASSSRGPDLLVLRNPRDGGPLRVYGYPRLDSLVWSATDAAPGIARVLAFDDDAGMLAFVDAKGEAGRVDFRLDNVDVNTKSRLGDIASVDGSSIYGIAKDGSVVRLTPSGEWTFKPPRPARGVVPLADGSLLTIGARDESAVVWRLHPPETKLLDSAEVRGAAKASWVQAGDRLYFAVERNLVGVRTRDLQPLNAIELDSHARAVVATPSGDRLYAIRDSANEVDIVDRYRERVSSRIDLPGRPQDLRIDALGRYLLVRGPAHDTVWVVAVGTDRLIGAVRSAWRQDLPFVAADGALALADGQDVVFVDGETLREKRRVPQGAGDFWYTFAWSGFRPRAANLDQPVRFPGADSADSAARAAGDTTAPTITPPARDTTTATAPAGPKGFLVSFAALLNEQKAKELAATIHVRGETARVLTSVRDGQAIYRVVLGPYPTKDDADRVGRESRQSYWVYEATP